MRLCRMSLVVLALIVPLGVVGTTTAAAQSGAGRQLLFYNHAYGVFDRETADAIEHSAYLREFANFEVRTTTGADGTWTARYLYGRTTYLELFGIGDVPDAGVGTAATAVSVEQDGDMATVVDRLREQGITPLELVQSRDFGDGVPVPWFDATFTTEQFDAFASWAMEYRPEYFADPRGNTEPPNHPGDVGRERYLSDAYRDHLMRDVTGVRIGVTEFDLANTVPLLRAGGFHLVSTSDGGVLAFGGGTVIRLEVTSLDQVGLREVTMSLNRPVLDRREERIGNSLLVVGPGVRAVWTFGDMR